LLLLFVFLFIDELIFRFDELWPTAVNACA